MSDPLPSPREELGAQWRNPEDILSLLLLIGGDIVQKSIAQMVGYHPFAPKHLAEKTRGCSALLARIPVTPVAFSFGWIAFGFNQVMSAVGDRRLLPVPEQSAIVVNCANAFTRDNKSWVLDRLLRDHEIRNRVDANMDSVRIDIFELGPLHQPKPDHVWWLGWFTILVQIGLAVASWVKYDRWGAMLVVLGGNLLAAVTCSLPQWTDEKWAGRTLDRNNVICLTRGNGHKHAMVIIGKEGCPDLETLSTANIAARPETPICTFILAGLWVCLLVSVSGLKEQSWFLVGAGGLGMLQNAYAAGAKRPSSTTGIQLRPFQRMPTITGKSAEVPYEPDATVDVEAAGRDVQPLETWIGSLKTPHPQKMPGWLESMAKTDGVPDWLEPAQTPADIIRVHGALKELEKWVPGAGLALIKIFFPARLDFEEDSVRDNINKKFWKRAWHTKRVRRNAEHARRRQEQTVHYD
ncbi:uncharacterized protein PG986_010394 [Apiospora aurea]|uniref:Uncharacterized protein n=1 Tax=Apiospora aurea TaxID=335848 RepID=A0ABR1Q3D1_9PEZI